jgi:hypothetical protein
MIGRTIYIMISFFTSVSRANYQTVGCTRHRLKRYEIELNRTEIQISVELATKTVTVILKRKNACAKAR